MYNSKVVEFKKKMQINYIKKYDKIHENIY